MRKIIAMLVLTTFGTMTYADEDGSLVVVELYTSEGCSSCPPADDILTKLSEYDDILALALHVDYWDYLGWKDEFAMKKFTNRQQIYNSVLPSRYRLVTPQMVFHGQSQIAGAKPTQVKKTLEKLHKQSDRISLGVEKKDTSFHISIDPRGEEVSNADVFVVQYSPLQVSKVKAGENRGKTLKHTNIVTSWERIGQWNGQAGFRIEQPLQGMDSSAIIVQISGNGPILAARRLE